MKEIKRFAVAISAALLTIVSLTIGLIVAVPFIIAAAIAGHRFARNLEKGMSTQNGEIIEGEFSRTSTTQDKAFKHS